MLTTNIEIIRELTKRNLYDYQTLSDLFDMLKVCEKKHFDFVHKLNKSVRSIASRQTANSKIEIAERVKFEKLYKRSLLFDAYWEFEAYLFYIEYDRPLRKKFYLPRINPLRIVVNDLQDLHDKKIKLLAVSLPPRVGKSTLGIFYISWLMGKYWEKTALMIGYGDKLARGFYKEVQGIINGEEYLWHDVFPECKIGKTSTEDLQIDINKDTRYPTLTCRSIEGQLTGIVDIKLLLYADDLIEGIEEALNPVRMDTKYGKYIGVVKDRKGDDVPELHIGTRWGVNDVIGRIKGQYEGNPLYRFRVIPALDESDRSNFDYDKTRNPSWDKIGFSTEYYLDMRETHESADDLATWDAKYQGEPYVREGLVFPEGALKYFDKKELPAGDPVIYIVCDVAWGGGDSLSSPIAYCYGNDVYIVDWIFSKGDKDETRPQMIAKLIQHHPHYVQFESNNGGDMYAEYLDDKLKEMGYRFNIGSVLTTGGVNANKHTEILTYAPDIKRNFHFLNRKCRSDDYKRAMKELFQYTQNGKVKHDDAPDSLKQLAKMIYDGKTTYEICDRPW